MESLLGLLSMLTREKYTTIKVEGDGELACNSIPAGMTEIKLTGKRLKFSAEAIAGVDTLYLKDIRVGMFFPETLRKLIIREYSGCVPLPNVHKIYVHANNDCNIDQPIEHYAYHFGQSDIPNEKLESDMFESVGDQEVLNVMGRDFTVVRRVPLAIQPSSPYAVLKTTVKAPILEPEFVTPFKGLQLFESAPLFEAETITGLDALMIDDVKEGQHFPETLDKLFLHDYSGQTPLPKVGNIYIHTSDVKKLTEPIEHYVYNFGSNSIKPSKRESKMYMCVGPEHEIKALNSTFTVIKRKPRVQVIPQSPQSPQSPLDALAGLDLNDPASRDKIVELMTNHQQLLQLLAQNMGNRS